MDTAYKIYANIMSEKLRRESDGKLEERQYGFSRGRGTIDAIYILNYVVNREVTRKKGKLFVFFTDLKATFDTVDRIEMETMLKMAEIKERLRKRIMETFKETRNSIKVGNKRTEEFWTEREVRQGCPMSPTLFNIYIMDLEKELKKEQIGGIVIGRKKIWSISYADDIVLLAASEQELKGMMKRFKRYLELIQGLVLIPDKSKVMVFERGRGCTKRRE